MPLRGPDHCAFFIEGEAPLVVCGNDLLKFSPCHWLAVPGQGRQQVVYTDPAAFTERDSQSLRLVSEDQAEETAGSSFVLAHRGHAVDPFFRRWNNGVICLRSSMSPPQRLRSMQKSGRRATPVAAR